MLAKKKVRYVGEAVCIVAAEDELTARHAAQLIDVTYEELPAVLTLEQAMADDGPPVHEDNTTYFRHFETKCGGNLAWECSFAEGNVDAAWAKCDLVVENDFETQAQAHVAMEPCAALAEVDAAGRVTVWSSNQSVFRVQANVSEALELPMSKVRCMTPRVGGGFGNKMEMHVQGMAAALALATGCPVKMVLTREEDFEMVRLRHPYRIRVKTGVSRDGKLIARDVDALVDCVGGSRFSWLTWGPVPVAADPESRRHAYARIPQPVHPTSSTSRLPGRPASRGSGPDPSPDP